MSFFADDHLIENAAGKVETIFDGKEWEQDQQIQELTGRKLAVRTLGKVHMPVVKRDIKRYVHNYLNRHRIVTFSKKLLSFRNYLPIFVRN